MRSLVVASQVVGKVPFRIHPEVLRVELDRGEVVALNGDWRGIEIANASRTLWLTQEGDPDDHILAAGERFIITCAGRVVVQGMRS